MRRRAGDDAYMLCGIAHTMSSADVTPPRVPRTLARFAKVGYLRLGEPKDC